MSTTHRNRLIATLATAAFALSACAPMQDMATNPDKEKTRRGAGYGAAAGAVIGLLTGGNDKFQAAMIGAAAGALAGGAVGYYMDKQEAKLREQMAGTGVDVVEVAGHTDNVGSDAYNQQLSEQRANSVATYLSGHGVARTRMVTVGAGEGHPVAGNDTDAGRAQNRRVEITIVPVTEESVQKAKQG